MSFIVWPTGGASRENAASRKRYHYPFSDQIETLKAHRVDFPGFARRNSVACPCSLRLPQRALLWLAPTVAEACSLSEAEPTADA